MFFRNKNKKKFARSGAVKNDGEVRFKIVGRHRHESLKKGRSLASQIFYRLAFLAFCGAVAYVLFFSPLAAVSEIEIRGAESLDPAAVREKIAAQISGKYLNAVPRNNIILLSKSALAENILREYKIAGAVEIRKSFPDKLTVSLNERKLGLVLCGGERCFVLDDQGQAFAPADFSNPQLKEDELVRLIDESGKNFVMGEAAMEKGYLQYILEIKEKIQEQAGVVVEQEVRTPQINSGDIRMRTEEGWQIFLDREIAPEKEATALRLVLENKISPDERKNLEYVDLRAENKVYYKFNNAEKQQTPDEAIKTNPEEEEKKKKKAN